MNVSEGLEKTVAKKRGYSLGNFKTQYKETETETLFELYHYGTLIFKARQIGTKIVKQPCYETCEEIKGLKWDEKEKQCKSCAVGTEKGYFEEDTVKDAWELVEWGGWSPSDRDRQNEAKNKLGIENAYFSGGVGGFYGSGHNLECWLNNVPVDTDLNPIVDLEALEKSIRSLRQIFNVEYRQYFGSNEGILFINPKCQYKVLDIRNKDGFDRLNGFNQNMALIRINDPESNPYTRFVLQIDAKRLNVYNVNVTYHKTVDKCLKFITRDATFRHGDLCFKKLPKLPETLKETHIKQWRDEENENTKIIGNKAVTTRKLEEEARIDSVSVEKAWNWLRNENPHVFTGNFTIYRLGRLQIVKARSELTISHKEHETLILPEGIYQFYAVHGLESARYGHD